MEFPDSLLDRRPGSAWDQDAVDYVLFLWREGFSGSRIAKKIGCGATRSTVMGLIHRKGATRYKNGAKRSPAVRKQRKTTEKAAVVSAPPAAALKPAVAKIVAARAIQIQPRPDPIRGFVPLHGLKEHMCRFPIGETRGAETQFCGCQRLQPFSYCEKHIRVTHQVPARLLARASRIKMSA